MKRTTFRRLYGAARASERTGQVLDRFLPVSLPTWDADSRRRARVLAALALCLLATGAILTATSISLGMYAEAAGTTVGAGIVAAVLWDLRRHGAMERAGIALGTMTLGVASHAAYELGGWGAPPLSWYAVVPLMLLLVAGRRVGIAFGGLAIAGYTAFFVLHQRGVEFGRPPTEEVRYADALTLTVAVLGLAMAYDWFKQRALAEMKMATDRLEQEVAEHQRTRGRLDSVKQQLVESARWAGMAEVATGVLHNVGNALTHVTTSAALLGERVGRLRLEGIERAAARLKSEGGGPEEGLLAQYLEELGKALKQDRDAMRSEAESLSAGLAQVSAIVATQQQYTGHVDHVEPVDLAQAIEDVVRLETNTLNAQGVSVVTRLEKLPAMPVSKHKFLLVLVNLLRNATDAVASRPEGERDVTIRLLRTGAGRLQLQVADNGAGIDPMHRPHIFQHGFTTKPDGHGFGLHSSALAARELGGRLTVESAGRGAGATFVLDLPWPEVAPEPPSADSRVDPESERRRSRSVETA